MKRVLFYCQHLLGIGHLTRSYAICHELVKSFEVDFVQGGPPVSLEFKSNLFKKIQLTPLLMNESTSELINSEGHSNNIEDIFLKRKLELKSIVESSNYDACIIELFPFGRKKFTHEVLNLIGELRDKNPNIKIYSSIRDILVEKPNQLEREKKICDILNNNFDGILIHSDPALITFDRTFKSVDLLKIPLIYTGYVTSQLRRNYEPVNQRKKQILLSSGGGVVGFEMVESVAQLASHFSDFKFVIPLGPYYPHASRQKLEVMALSSKNLQITPLLQNFSEVMCESSLSISLAGYNTIMDILSSQTAALVFPYLANHEQNMRAQKLRDLGYLGVFSNEDLEPERLTSLIQETLKKTPPDHEIKIDGAASTAQYLSEVLV